MRAVAESARAREEGFKEIWMKAVDMDTSKHLHVQFRTLVKSGTVDPARLSLPLAPVLVLAPCPYACASPLALGFSLKKLGTMGG